MRPMAMRLGQGSLVSVDPASLQDPGVVPSLRFEECRVKQMPIIQSYLHGHDAFVDIKHDFTRSTASGMTVELGASKPLSLCTNPAQPLGSRPRRMEPDSDNRYL